MIHCYTECTVVSDDEYRTRYDCKICKRTYYTIKDRTVESKDAKDSGTTFKHGSPFIVCENCGQEEKLHWSKPVRVLLGWEENGKKYDRVGYEHPLVPQTVAPGTRIVVPSRIPIIRQVKGCRDCYNEQQTQSARLGKPHYFGTENRPKVEQTVQIPLSKTILAPKESVVVVPYSFPSGSKARIAQYNQDKVDDYTAEVEGLYGPYHDRKAK